MLIAAFVILGVVVLLGSMLALLHLREAQRPLLGLSVRLCVPKT